jgi:YD repeat-containing protein
MKYISLLSMLFIALALPAQNISYKYDAAGNRTERVITLQSQSQLRSSSYTSTVTSIDDIIADHQIKIYPNPTKGMLSVEVGEITEKGQAEFLLTDMSGRIINRQRSGAGTVYFDLSRYSSGVYILRIIINGEAVSWKIIKE